MSTTFPRRRLSARCDCCGPVGISRRSFVASGIAAVAAAGLAPLPTAAQANARRIDVHHHLAPPKWIADVVVGRKTGQRPLANWTPAKAIEDMDRGGVATAVTSISKAVVYTHPVRADCCRDLIPDVAAPVVELPADTTRTILSVVFSGTAVRCPDIRFIWSHAGGSLPMLTNRIARYAAGRKDLANRYPDGVMHELQKFYYDTASASYPSTLAPLMHLVPPSQVVFGTDFPFGSSAATAKGLAEYGFADNDLRDIERENAAKLFPRFGN